jgi:hypothetical protein
MPRELWAAAATPDIVTVPARTVLTVVNKGAPEGEVFQHSVQAIYGVAYTLKFARKKAGRRDFKIGPLEARWWTTDPARALPEVPRSEWRWQLRIAVPDNVTESEVREAIETATHRKGGKLEGNTQAAGITVTTLGATRFGRVLHLGPYANEGESFLRIGEMLRNAGVVGGKAHSEVYLNDPRRTKEEKLKTVLLLEVV